MRLRKVVRLRRLRRAWIFQSGRWGLGRTGGMMVSGGLDEERDKAYGIRQKFKG